MAIARGAGTEIIRSAHFEDCKNTTQKLIVGVQHHIYTVLSITFRCIARSGTEEGYIWFKGYDALAGTTAEDITLVVIALNAKETFVWNDKFSFNGYEPTDFLGPMDDATKQDAIADQGSSVSQYLAFVSDSSGTQFDLSITFIDQNNA